MKSLTQALLTIRFIILIAAMEHCVLRAESARHWLYGVMAASAAYIAFQCLFQFQCLSQSLFLSLFLSQYQLLC